jgi:hypothetical protein
MMHYKDTQVLKKLDALFFSEPVPQRTLVRDD